MAQSTGGSKGPKWLEHVTGAQRKTDVPEIKPGDQVRIWYRIIEKDRIRVAPFEGLVSRRRGSGFTESVTVRRVTHGEGVERVFPLHAPVLDRIEVLRRGKVHRARLYYLRDKVGKTRIADADMAHGAKPTGDAGRAAAPAEQPESTPAG